MASIEQPNFSNVLSWRDHLPREITQSEAPSDLRKHSSDRELRKRAREEASRWIPAANKARPVALEKRCAAVRKILTNACNEADRAVPESDLSANTELLLDNAALLRACLREVRGALEHAGKLPQVQQDGTMQIRICAVASAYFRAAGFRLDERVVIAFLNAIQQEVPLEMMELWLLKPAMELLLLEHAAQFADYAEPFSNAQSRMPEFSECQPETDLNTVIKCLRQLADSDWKEIFEQCSRTESVLKGDPAGAYSRMDFEHRDVYRQAIRKMAQHSAVGEIEIARAAIALAAEAQETPNLPERAKERRSHIGFYLIAEGKAQLHQRIAYKVPVVERVQMYVKRYGTEFYLASITLAALAALLFFVTKTSGAGLLGIAAAALFLFPAAEWAVAVVNQMVTAGLPPQALQRLDFSEGIPDECATMVAVPMLLLNEQQVRRAVHDLEIRYLANRDSNLYFALVTDAPDSRDPSDDKRELVELGSRLIRDLNNRYAADGVGSFFLFHRRSQFNSAEGVWMGWERKRGKILDFNALLLNQADAFPVKAGELSVLREIRYVITLDQDTELPRDAAHKLIGTLAHPLNRAVIHPILNRVVEGYGILQPRVGISIQSASRSRLAGIMSGETGFDIYTRAVSDVYQDLFGEGNFTGKGIYEVSVFQEVLGNRFPSNTLLSHDLIEGSLARAGLVSDVEVIEDYPSTISAFSRRKHRWIRGDWQVLRWLFSRVPDRQGRIVPNSLSAISRWKIADNLRRSLTESASVALLAGAWFFAPQKAACWTAMVLGAIVMPAYLQAAIAICKAGRARYISAFWRNLGAGLVQEHARLFVRIAFLLHQSLVSMDGVVRALVRMTISRKKLLEWETAAAAELAKKKGPVDHYLEVMPYMATAATVLLGAFHPKVMPVALPLLVLWGASKWIAGWLNRSAQRVQPVAGDDAAMLRLAALRTWRFFREFSGAQENWLIPDAVQESPALIAHRASPTNMGFLLSSRLAALDLGFITLQEFIIATQRTLDAISKLEKWNGHLYNWYDTQTLEKLDPLFISAVDNGNLACCLWTLKQGCLEALKHPVLRPSVWQGMKDHVGVIEEIASTDSIAEPMRTEVKNLLHSFRTKIDDMASAGPAWPQLLPEAEEVASSLKRCLLEAVEGEAPWWAYELSLRISKLWKLVYDVAPWLLPQFSAYADDIAANAGCDLTQLTFASAAAVRSELTAIMRDRLRSAEQAGDKVDPDLQFFHSALVRSAAVSHSFELLLADLASAAEQLVRDMNFALLYNPKKKLLSIGYDVSAGRLSESHYDFLASEARTAAFVAIAKSEIPQESWLQLDRSHIDYKGSHTLLSWTGTMFEYLMPSLWMKLYPDTILDRSARAAVRCQQRFVGSRPMPWGISEAAYNEKTEDGQFRYRAFGVPGLALKQEGSQDVVVSPYSGFLSLPIDPARAIQNIRLMKKLGWCGEYGFYESADFTRSRVSQEEQFEVVRCWMPHHQGMILGALANTLCEFALQRRFHAEPSVQATELLLQEKAPYIPSVEPVSKVEVNAAMLLNPRRPRLRPHEYWVQPSSVRIPA